MALLRGAVARQTNPPASLRANADAVIAGGLAPFGVGSTSGRDCEDLAAEYEFDAPVEVPPFDVQQEGKLRGLWQGARCLPPPERRRDDRARGALCVRLR